MSVLFFQIVILVVAIFVFQVFHLEDTYTLKSKKHGLAIGLLAGMGSALCMAFPIPFGQNGAIMDLRWIGFIVAILYGGPIGWAVCSACILLFRFYIGGPTACNVLFSLVIVSVLTFLIRNRYWKSTRLVKTIYASSISLLSFLSMPTGLAFLQYRHGFGAVSTKFYMTLSVFYVGTMIIGIYLIENVLESATMRKAIVQSEKLKAVGEIAASFAHEVRNPLTVVKGFLQLMQTEETPNPTYFEFAIEELERTNYIISDYLSFSKPLAYHVDDINLAESIRSVVHVMNSMALMNGVAIRTSIRDKAIAFGSETRFKQIVMNLVKNAIEALPSGGDIEIRLSSDGEHAELTVTDNGEGMSEEQLLHMGESFYTTKEKGTGLGLAVTYKIVSEFSGKLTFQSELGKGTTALVRIPLADSATREARATAAVRSNEEPA